MHRLAFALLPLALALVACQPPPPPRTAPTPTPQAAPKPDPTAKAIAAYRTKLAEADPDGAIVARVEEAGARGAAAVAITDDWQLLPESTRENSATDLYKLWVSAWVESGGDRDVAQLLIVNRHGKTVAQGTAAWVRLKD
jgi:hypothetical protein